MIASLPGELKQTVWQVCKEGYVVVGTEVGKDAIMAWKTKIVLFSPVYRKAEVSGGCGIPISLSFCYLECNR